MRKKRLPLLMMILALPLALMACANSPASTPLASPSAAAKIGSAVEGEGYRKISPDEAKGLIGQEGVILLDVRTAAEYEQGYIPGAALLPVDELAAKTEAMLPDKESKVIVYCRSGRRSANASKQLVKMGYKNVYDLGGIQSWPYEVVKK